MQCKESLRFSEIFFLPRGIQFPSKFTYKKQKFKIINLHLLQRNFIFLDFQFIQQLALNSLLDLGRVGPIMCDCSIFLKMSFLNENSTEKAMLLDRGKNKTYKNTKTVQITQAYRSVPVWRKLFLFNRSSSSDGWVLSSLISNALLKSTARPNRTKRTAVFILNCGSKFNPTCTLLSVL